METSTHSEWTSTRTFGYVLLGADAANPADGLPFFSKVNLKKHIQGLLAMQNRVGIIGI
jgi:hypothetical protein